MYNAGSTCEGSSDNNCSLSFTAPKKVKPIEIYAFIDPVCPKCWGLEPVLKKLTVEYGDYFTLRILIGNRINGLEKIAGKKRETKGWGKSANLTGMPSDGDDHPLHLTSSAYSVMIAIKAAELQGKAPGERYLRIIRERLFIEKRDISQMEILLECAEKAKLDLDEFRKDMNSQGPIKALQCDRRMTNEMEVREMPTLVFFHASDEKEGVKVTGQYPYSVYVQILTETLGKTPKKSAPPSIQAFLKKYKFVANKELAVVYDVNEQEMMREMKKLKLKQKAEPVTVKYGTFWRYIGE